MTEAASPIFRRRFGEPSWEEIVIMPFAVGLCLAVVLRRWLRRRLGMRAGNVVGKLAILLLGAPPLLVAYLVVRFLRLVLNLVERLESWIKRPPLSRAVSDEAER
jgi:predicted PurR-regulated permease PerM